MDPKYLMNNLTKTFSPFLIVIPPLCLMPLWYLPLTQSRRERQAMLQSPCKTHVILLRNLDSLNSAHTVLHAQNGRTTGELTCIVKVSFIELSVFYREE